MSKQPQPAPTASTVGPCPTVIQIVGRPGTGRLPSTIAPPDHPFDGMKMIETYKCIHLHLHCLHREKHMFTTTTRNIVRCPLINVPRE